MPPASFEIASAIATHVGLVRKLNEDACLERPEIGLWVVADGMGGHQAGDVASRMIVDTLAALQPSGDPGALLAEVRASISEANRLLLEEAARRGPEAVVGSTVVVLLSHGSHFACLWAGDSRLYRYRAGVLEQVSRDHSQVQELVDAGLVNADQAEAHPLANVITRAVGTQPELELDKITDRLEPDDLFLLCTDGLTKMVADREVARILGATPLLEMPTALIDAALANGGKDNVTVVVVRFTDDITVSPAGPASENY